jgi:hypothetical protein
MPGDVVKDFFVGSAPLDDGEYILFMTWEHRHLTSFPSLAILDMHEELPIVSNVHIAHPQVT